MSGDLTATISGTGTGQAGESKVVAATDYWLSDEYLRANLESMTKFGGSKLTPEELKAKVDQKMKADPRLYLLTMNCSTDSGTLNLSAASGSHYKDVPFKPGHYPITSEAKPGAMNITLMLKNGSATDLYEVTGAGSLELSQFDTRGVAGTFSFQAEKSMGQGKKKVELKGKFSYGCIGDKCTK